MKDTGNEWGDRSDPIWVMASPGEFWVGRVVRRIDGDKDLGHIVRFARNAVGEVIPVIMWSSGEERPQHPSGITLQ